MRFQFGISSSGWGGRRIPPYAITEQGVAMFSSVLRSKRAIQVNIQIMDKFAWLRQMIMSNKELTRKIKALERKYDEQFRVVFTAIQQLLSPVKQVPQHSLHFFVGHNLALLGLFSSF
ncbi:MAG: hypothetical protein ACE5I1_13955, partial [bacterium]